MARGWFSKLLDYGFNKQAWDENFDRDNATPWTQDASNIWRGITHYGFNRDAWASDKAANDSLGAFGRELGAIGTIAGAGYLASTATPYVAKAVTSPVAKTVGNAVWKYGGEDAVKAVGGSVIKDAFTPDQPQGGGLGPTSAPSQFDYAKLAQQMYQNQPSGLRYGGTFGSRGGGGQRGRSMTNTGFRGW